MTQAESNVQDLRIDAELTVQTAPDDPAWEVLQKLSLAAVEPDVDKLEVGMTMHVLTPFYRKAKVVEKKGRRVRLAVKRELDIHMKGKTHTQVEHWQEVWGVADVQVIARDQFGRLASVDGVVQVNLEEHLVVLQDGRAKAHAAASRMVPEIDAETMARMRRKEFVPNWQIVTVVPIVESDKAKQAG